MALTKRQRQVAQLSARYVEALQLLYDEMDEDEYESDAVQASVSAQSYAQDAAEADS